MAARRSTKTHQILRSRALGSEAAPLEFLEEEPFLIRVNDTPYLVVMRTPGEEVYQAAGFCLGEGIVDSPDDLENIGYDELQDANVVDVWLKPERLAKVRDLLERKRYVSQTSCGICGKELIEHLHQNLTTAEHGCEIGIERVFACLEKLDQNQEYYETTRCSHAALLFDDRAELMCVSEDVGRHNALDKAIGKTLMNGRLAEASIVVLSSRNSYELIQKAARARLEIMISKSRPTALAVALGKSLNMTLAFPDRSELVVVCGEERIRGA